MSETIYKIQADQLLVDGDTATLVVEPQMLRRFNGGHGGEFPSGPPPELVALNRLCDACDGESDGDYPCLHCFNGREPFTLEWPCQHPYHGVVSLRVAFRGDMPQMVPIVDRHARLDVAWMTHAAQAKYGDDTWLLWKGPNVEAGENPSTGRYPWKRTPIPLPSAATPGMFVAFLDVEPTP